NAWGNSGAVVAVANVQEVRGRSRFKTYDALKAAANYAPLPKPPEGFAIREVARFTENPVRVAVQGGELYVLSDPGNLWRVEKSGRVQQVMRGEQYLEPQRGTVSTLGFTFDKAGRLFVTS